MPVAQFEVVAADRDIGAGAFSVIQPLLIVTRPAAPLTRDDWAIAEGAARDFCAGQGAPFYLLPPVDGVTQVSYDDGTWTFIAVCDLSG